MKICRGKSVKLWVLMLFTCLISYRVMATNNVEAKWETADATVRQLFDIRAAVFAFFDSNRAWPVTIETLTDPTNLYYGGRLETPYNTKVNGSISTDGKFYVFSMDVGRSELAEYIARKLNGTSAASDVTFKVGVPASYSLYKGALKREAAAGQPELNEMATDLSMGGFDINNVDILNTSVINAGAANFNTVNINNIAQLNGGLNTTNIAAQTIVTTGTITANGEIDAKAGIKANVVDAQALNVSNATVLNGTTVIKGALDVEGMTNFVNNVTFIEEVIFTKPIQSDDIGAQTANIVSLNVSGNQVVSGSLNVGSEISTPVVEATNANISQTLTATNATINGVQTINGTQTVNGSQTVTGSQNINSNSIISGTQTAGSLIVNGATVLGQTTINNALIINAGIASNEVATFMKGINFVDGNSGINKGNNDALRIKTKSAWLDIGNFETGWLNVDTNQNGVKFSKPIQAPNLTVLGTGDKEVTIRSVNGGQAIVTFSNDSSVADAQLALIDDNTLALLNARFNANAGLVVNGQPAIFNSGATFNTDATFTQSVYANRFVENGQALADKYLGITAKAVDADLLDGVDIQQIARTDVNETFNANVTIDGVLGANGGLTVNGAQIISSDGTLYQGGVPISDLFLSAGGQAEDSDLLDGLDSSQFARRDIDPNFSGNVTTNGRVYAKNGVHIQGDWLRINGRNGIYFESYGGGWHMSDTSWLRAYAGKSIYTTGVLRADNGIWVDDRLVVSADGNTLYENGLALSGHYLGIDNQAVDSARLGGIIGTNYARTDIAETFGSDITVNGNIFEDGTSLSAKYLGITATAENAELLDGINSTSFARRDQDNIFTGVGTFTQPLKINTATGDLTIGSSNSTYSHFNTSNARFWFNKPIEVVSSIKVYNSGTLMTDTDIYEAGTKLSDKYLGIDATATNAGNAALLNGVDASSYARTDISESFASDVVINGDLLTNGVKNTAGNWLLKTSATRTQLMINGATRFYVDQQGSLSPGRHYVQGSLTAVGAAEFKGRTTIGGSLFAQAATFDKNVSILGDLSVQGVGDVKSKFDNIETRLSSLESKPTITSEDLRMDYVIEYGTSSADTVTKYASCRSGYRLISCSGGALTPGNGSWEDNEGSLIEPLPASNQCRLFGEGGSGNNPVAWRLTAICMKGGI